MLYRARLHLLVFNKEQRKVRHFMNELVRSNTSLSKSENISLFNLSERNRQAEQVIRDYARGHAAADVGIGILGTLIPGATIPALIASIAGQAPLVYQPMSKRLASIYSATPDQVTNRIVIESAVIGGLGDLAAELASEFMAEIALELLQEAGFGVVASAIPFFGGIVAAGLDATIAATLTWRVGTMIAIYHQNGGWIEDRHATYQRAKKMVGSLSPITDDRVNLDDIPLKNQEVLDKQMAVVKELVSMMLSVSVGKEQIHAALLQRKIPQQLIELALKNLA
jgi:hypothetical protein